ncbi:MAG: hypothetical protein HYX93_06115 [Chloroflexi bacterium]|nr:hypothetical protein [Chloroflexota bacterium]
MELYFEKGTRDAPKGHALLFFRQRYNQEEILATYLVTLPVSVDVAKYIPPMFASQMQGMTAQELSGFAFPPVPEHVEGLSQLRRLAEARDDDLLDGGTCDSSDPMQLLQLVNDMQQEYSRLYQGFLEAQAPVASSTVSDVLYDLMGERDKLGELSKLVGKLRFAAEGSDSHLVRETEEEIQTLGRYLPEHYRISRIIKTAEMPLPVGARLAQLYLERCYKLHEEDYRRVQEVEGEIKQIEEGLES